jgi:MFS family permease
LLASRGLGQSALSVCSITTVARWFPGRAGFAMGAYSILLSVWFALAFGAVGYVVREHGWRTAWWQIALALVLVIAPIVALFHREPTGMAEALRDATGVLSASNAAGHESDRARKPGLTLAEALRSGAFWLFAGGAAAFNLVSSGLGLFNEAVLAERGFDRRTFHFFLAGTTLLSLGGQFLCGWLTRRWSHQSLMAVALFLYALGLAMLPVISHGWHLAVAAVPLGLAGGMIIVIFFSVWGDLFGQRQLGRIQGAAQMVTVLSSALGPVVFAASSERWHSYSPLLLALAGITLLLALSARWVPRPSPAR